MIALIAILAAILFPTHTQAREKPAPAGGQSPPASLTATALTYSPSCAYDGIENALSASKGRRLVLDVRGGTNIPALRPAEPASLSQQQFRVFQDGHIWNVLLGDHGYLTRVPAGPGHATVRFAAYDPNNPNQVWCFKKGPQRPASGPFATECYTLIVAPLSPNARSLMLLTARGRDGQITLEERKYPLSHQALEQLPLGQCWDFGPDAAFQDQPEVALRWDRPLPAPATGLSLAAFPMAGGVEPASWRAPHACQSFQHVADACDSLWHNPACGGSKSTWLGSCTLIDGKCTCLHSSS